MSKINQIQTKLKAIDQAKFQRLCDAYLYRRGYENINPIGLVIGADKVAKGTPDTLISLPGGGYVLVEYTTQQTGIVKKFLEDLEKCFNSDKTGIPQDEIKEIIICHNFNMNVEDERSLITACKSKGCILTIFGIGPISHDLYQKYPGLARDFLDVEIDTGQVLTPQEFVTAYQKSAFATPLDTRFQIRNQEIIQTISALESSNIVIISGRAGVGKSRFALEVCERFAAINSKTVVKCIFNRGVDLFQDLQVYFTPPGHYLIFVDDANRLTQIDYILQRLYLGDDEHNIKLILTVRDYALDKILKMARPYGDVKEIVLSPLTDEQIFSLIHETFNIKNGYYLLRIGDIAKGNPRLAVMAAQVVQNRGNLDSIADASTLYDEYFQSIQRDIGDFGNKQLLKVAGIISFFRVVDRSNEAMMQSVAESFEIDTNTFWEYTRQLHKFEMLDMYEDEVVRVSDQVLAVYLFYLAFIKNRALDISTLIRKFLQHFQYRLIDSINSLHGSFSQEEILSVLKPHVSQVWKEIQFEKNEVLALQFIDIFSFVQPTESLIYLRDRVLDLEPHILNIDPLYFMPSESDIQKPSLINSISMMKYEDETFRPSALMLLLNYAEKRPQELPQVLHLIIRFFCIRKDSHLSGFSIEKNFMGELWKRTENGVNLLYTRMFMQMAKIYLSMDFESIIPVNPRSVEIIQLKAQEVPEFRQFRHSIWVRLFELFQQSNVQDVILELIRSQTNQRTANVQILTWDLEELMPFFENMLAPDRFIHCLTVQQYLQNIKRYKIPFKDSILNDFRSEVYKLSEILLGNQEERIKIGWRVYETQKHRNISVYFAEYHLKDYQLCFEYASEILATLNGYDSSIFLSSMEFVLGNLADTNKNLYLDVIHLYLESGNTLNLHSSNIINKLIAVFGMENAYDILVQHEYFQQRQWVFNFFKQLDRSQVQAQHVEKILNLYQNADFNELLNDLHYLIKYIPIDYDIIAKVTEILVSKAETESRFCFALRDLFDPYGKILANLNIYFSNNYLILKRAYLLTHISQLNDDDGTAYMTLLNFDRDFSREFTIFLCQESSVINLHEHRCDYSALWLQDDYQTLFEGIIWKIFELIEKQLCYSYLQILSIFFKVEGTHYAVGDINNRQRLFFQTMIEGNYNKISFMQLVFRVIGEFPPEQRIPFIKLFLYYNQNFEDFCQLWLEPMIFSWSGSPVFMYQDRINFYDSLLPLMTNLELLNHRQHIEQQISELYRMVEIAKKRDFIGL